MGENKIVKWLAHTPNAPSRNGWIAGLGTLPYFIPKVWQHLEENQGSVTPELLLHAIPTMAAFITAYIGTVALHTRTKKENATKKGDYKKVKELKKQLSRTKPPEIPFSGEQKISYKLQDMLKYYYIPFLRHSAESAEKKARENKNPLLMLDAALKYGGRRQQFDKSLILIRDALEWLGGRKPKISLSTQTMFWHAKLALKMARRLDALEPSVYMMSAAYDAIMNPERAWYWSQLGRMITSLSTARKKEMYVFHALLAIAQNRSDQKEAFKDAFHLLHETCTPRRLGESRYPTWTVEDEKGEEFFSGTFAFKGNEKLSDLQNERKGAITLEERVLDETAIAPQPLYITDEPHHGLYIYVMRYLKGELLAHQLKEGNKSGLYKVIPVLARIHARYPTEGLPRMDVEQKTRKKLEQLGLQDAIQLFTPVTRDLQSQTAWAVNKDAHPEQWQIITDPYSEAKVGVLDTDMREVQPVILDSANLFEYCGDFTPAERQALILQFAHCLKEENVHLNRGISTLFRAHSNATLHRALCLITAWNEKGRNKTQQEKQHVINNAIRAVNDIQSDDPAYYRQHQESYDKLPAFYEKLAELKPS
jgi:hypothetical protein